MKYLIDFVDGTDEQMILDWMSANGVQNPVKLNALDLYVVECASQPSQSKIVDLIQPDENISNQLLGDVEIIPLTTNESTTFTHDSNWWMTASVYEVDFSTTSTTFDRRGSKSNVYIVDSGITRSHPEFANANIDLLFTFSDNFEDTNGHGTVLSSLVVGQTLGITSSTLKVVKVFDNTKTTMISDLINAFDAILSDIQSNVGVFPVVNLSWSIAKNTYVESKLQQLIDAGAFVVAAAGNDGTAIQDVTPASMEQVITVGAYTEDFVPADFSNYTSDVKNTTGETNYGALDVWAPGVNIGAALIDGTNGTVAGTSISAAIVSACVAYNSDNIFTTDAYIPSGVEFMTWMTTRKENMLTLSDKYASSKNVISSFATKAWSSDYSGSRQIAKVVYANHDTYIYLTLNTFITKIELDGTLPEGLSLSKGWIVGKLVNSPASATETLAYVATITFEDGKTNTFPVTLFLAPATTEVGVIPDDVPAHPALLCQVCTDCTKTCTCTSCI